MPHFLVERDPIPQGSLPRPMSVHLVGGCYRTATWRVACGPDVRFLCDSHEGPPCGGVFANNFMIRPDTTRDDLAGVLACGLHRIHSSSGRDVHDLRCCACGEWIGDAKDAEISQISIPMDAKCEERCPVTDLDTVEVRCRACEEMWGEVTRSSIPPGSS